MACIQTVSAISIKKSCNVRALPQGPDLGLRSGRSAIGHIPESPGLVLDWSGRRRDSSPLEPGESTVVTGRWQGEHL